MNEANRLANEAIVLVEEIIKLEGSNVAAKVNALECIQHNAKLAITMLQNVETKEEKPNGP